MAEPRKAKVTGTFAYNDGSVFNGLALVLLQLPTDGSAVVWPSAARGAGTQDRLRIPLAFPIPIVEGVPNSTATLYFTADMQPPNTRYNMYVFDINRKLVAGPTAMFQVTADPTALTVPVLTAPTAPAVPNNIPQV